MTAERVRTIADQYDGEFASEYVDDGIPAEDDPGGEFDLSWESGLQTGYDTTAAEIGHTIVQGQADIAQQLAAQAQEDHWQQQMDAARSVVQRDLSAGEYAALAADAADPNGHHDIAAVLNDYWTPASDSRADRMEHKAKIMRNTIEAQQFNAMPDQVEALPGPNDDNYGLGDNPDRQALRDARTAWMVQRQNYGEIG